MNKEKQQEALRIVKYLKELKGEVMESENFQQIEEKTAKGLKNKIEHLITITHELISEK
jgi:hypothetical protein